MGNNIKLVHKPKDILQEWDIKVSDFEDGFFGNLMGKFKVYRSIATGWLMSQTQYELGELSEPYRYIGAYLDTGKILNPQVNDVVAITSRYWWDPINKVETKDNVFAQYTSSGWVDIAKAVPSTDAVGNTIVETVIDKQKVISELALIYIIRLYSMYPQLREIGYHHLLNGTQENLKAGILQGIQYGITNRNVLTRINSVAKEGQGISVTANVTEPLLHSDMFGEQALAFIENSEIDKYGVVSSEEAKILTENGNVTFLGKFEPTWIKDID